MVQPRCPTPNWDSTWDRARNSSREATWLGSQLPSSGRSSRFLSAEMPKAPAFMASWRICFIWFSSSSVTEVRSRAGIMPST